MTLDENALDIAVQALRPLFREPVSYLEKAARDSITAYLTAAITAEARLAECERERDEARKRADAISDLLSTTQLCAEKITQQRDEARARVAVLEEALSGLLDDIEQRAAAYRLHPSADVRSHYKNIPLSDGRMYAARAALKEAT